MKKYLLMTVVAVMAAMSVNAQQKGEFNYKVRLGGSMTTFTGYDNAKMEPNLNYAFGLDYMIADRLALGLEVLTNYMGAKNKDLDMRTELLYTGIPLLAKYYVTPWVALQAGPQISILHTAKIDGEKYFNGQKVKDDLKKVEFAIPLGVSFEPTIGHNGDALLIDLRYHLGLSPVNKKYDSDDKSHYNSAILLTIGYRTDFMR